MQKIEVEIQKNWFSLFYISARQVNVVMAQSYLVANLIVLILTLVVNLWTGVIILRKERTRIHMLIVFDCVANILSSVQTSFIQVRPTIRSQTTPKTK